MFEFTCPECGCHRFSAYELVTCGGDHCRFSVPKHDAWQYCGFSSAEECSREWGWKQQKGLDRGK